MLNNVSLSAIHTFTVVAKELSFSRAADVLHITPSAVSHQMKLLEQQLNLKLFIRQSKGVSLTQAGQTLFRHSQSGIKDIQHGLQQSQFVGQKQKLTIAMIPSLCDLWFVPRLPSFRQACPNIELELVAQDQLVDFTSNRYDGHIHFGTGNYKGIKAEFLAQETVYPVCHPSLIESVQPELEVMLLSNTLLHYQAGIEDEPGGVTWADWFNHFGLTRPEKRDQIWFSHVALALNAAKHHQGIALGWHHMVENDIDTGGLARISETQLTTRFAYYLTAPAKSWQNENFRQFSNWLRAQFAP